MHCKIIKIHNHQVPKTVRVPGNERNTKKIKKKFANNPRRNYNKYRIY